MIQQKPESLLICEGCGMWFKPQQTSQVLCGSATNRIGCSYEAYKDYRNYYNPKKSVTTEDLIRLCWLRSNSDSSLDPYIQWFINHHVDKNRAKIRKAYKANKRTMEPNHDVSTEDNVITPEQEVEALHDDQNKHVPDAEEAAEVSHAKPGEDNS